MSESDFSFESKKPQSPSLTSRRRFAEILAGVGVGGAVFQRALSAQVADQGKVTQEMIAAAEWTADIELEESDRERVASAMERSLRGARQLREVPVDADTVPALTFRPDFFYEQVSRFDDPRVEVGFSRVEPTPQLADEALAFASIEQQATLLQEKKLSSVELTRMYLDRLIKYDPLLKCVVTLLEEHALASALESDQRRANGRTLGILDGIPWVAKDLVAVPPWKTTWGAAPFQDQVRAEEATVARQLREAGAVLMAKVTLGALAWGDKWFGGMTRNPWNPEQGSSGSSAGSSSAVAAGLASFALGSETLGSIVSPTRRCRTSGLRPTFGRVSRAGCMPLAWSMDKIGPIARHVSDLSYVFAALLGTDGRDPTLVERGFQWPPDTQLSSLKVGVTGDRLNTTEEQALQFLESEGATIEEVDLTTELPLNAMSFILGVEASTVFDDAFRSDPQADYGNWPGTFQQSQFVPAIQYLRANRMRGQLIRETEKKLAAVDIVLGGNDLLLANLTGHPSIVVACGADESDGIAMPGVVKMTSSAYREQQLLAVAASLQAAMPPKPSQPPLDQRLSELQAEQDKPDESPS